MKETGNHVIINGRYLLLKAIGNGGAGKVYQVRDIKNGKIYALKQYRTSDPNNKEVLWENIKRELNVLRYTTHPVLPKIYNLIMEDETFFLVMEYVEGTNLKEIVDENGALSQGEVLAIMEQVCSGLYYLHSLNPPIVYRDLKPANMILKKDGSVKLIDFGIAKRYNKELKADDFAYGTKGFAAPEQFGTAQGIGIYNTDIRSDVYGIGTTIYYLLTGRVYKNNAKSFWISKRLQKIIQTCTQIRPADRYHDCIDVLCQLRQCREKNIRKILHPIVKKISRK